MSVAPKHAEAYRKLHEAIAVLVDAAIAWRHHHNPDAPLSMDMHDDGSEEWRAVLTAKEEVDRCFLEDVKCNQERIDGLMRETWGVSRPIDGKPDQSDYGFLRDSMQIEMGKHHLHVGFLPRAWYTMPQ
jgi:hypothetical protein